MAGYVELPSNRTWYDERGNGTPLVLLHGGVVDATFFDQNIDALAKHFRVLALDLRGHGHTPDVEGPFSYDAFAQDTIEFIEAVVDGPTHVVGHSVGAAVALFVALRRPDLVRQLVMVSGTFHHSGELGSGDEPPVDDIVAAFGPAYAAASPDGADHYPVVIRKVFELSAREPNLTAADVAAVTNRTLVMIGDDDIITLEHTIELYRAIPNSELAVVPGTSHFLLQEKPAACDAIMLDFLTNEPVPTVAPVRRA